MSRRDCELSFSAPRLFFLFLPFKMYIIASKKGRKSERSGRKRDPLAWDSAFWVLSALRWLFEREREKRRSPLYLITL